MYLLLPTDAFNAVFFIFFLFIYLFYFAAKCPQTTLPNHPSPGLSPHPSDSYTPSLVSPGCLDLKTPAYFSMPNGSQHPTSGDPEDTTGLEKPFNELSVSEHDEAKGHDQLDEHQGKLNLSKFVFTAAYNFFFFFFFLQQHTKICQFTMYLLAGANQAVTTLLGITSNHAGF